MTLTQWTGRWVAGVLPLGALHAALFAVLQSRPGAVGPFLWTWGPGAVIASAALLLAGALASAVFGGASWTVSRALGLLGLIAIVGTTGVYRVYPSSHDGAPSTVEFQLPLTGPVKVAWGGASEATNYHVISPGERWGYDLLVTSGDRTYRDEGRSPEEYYAYGRTVLAPADGRVVSVRDGIPDSAPGSANRHAGAGNHVVLEVAERQYLFIAHLRPGSVSVELDQQIRAGQPIGEIGNSGNSSEPHLHLHLQDSPQPDSGEGIPFGFADANLAGTDPPVAKPMPEGGMREGKYVGDEVESRN